MAPPSCGHAGLSFHPSVHAAQTGYQQRTKRQLAAAADLARDKELPDETSFPYPLVLPDDDLALDPKQPGQGVRSWRILKERNRPTAERKTIYVAEPPTIEPSVSFMRSWSCPIKGAKDADSPPELAGGIGNSRMENIVAYLSAFFHGMDVTKLKSPQLGFTEYSPKKKRAPAQIGLSAQGHCTRIRSRACPDGTFSAQLNLKDLTDCMLDILPGDAYAFLMIVDQDIYEDENDDFTCGRAYGGSRVAVVSSVRYNPCLDKSMGVGRVHAWPASHCAKYMEEKCNPLEQDHQGTKPKKRKRSPGQQAEDSSTTALVGSSASEPIDLTGSSPVVKGQPDLSATSHSNLTRGPIHAALLSSTSAPISASTLHLSRLARTASHELCHCFGIGHCVCYACVMQSSASLAEDARQPPYLCPIDSRKLMEAMGELRHDERTCRKSVMSPQEWEEFQGKWTRERYVALRGVCLRWARPDAQTDRGAEEGGMLAGFAAWSDGVVT